MILSSDPLRRRGLAAIAAAALHRPVQGRAWPTSYSPTARPPPPAGAAVLTDGRDPHM